MNTKKFSSFIEINGKKIGDTEKTYFIADIAANHDGSLDRAIKLIELAKNAGADAAKFQHFKAETIVSGKGFQLLGDQRSHQANWKKSVVEVYKQASIDLSWTRELKKRCEKIGIDFFTSPYDMQIVDEIDSYVPAYKIGSGDITWLDIIEKIASKNKPYIMACGASSMDEVIRVIEFASAINPNLALLQCNTNYTASLDNFKYIQLNVLKSFKEMFPGLILGLSDHTPGHSTVLGAVALGAKIIEKHFTDDITREGPDHKFSMDPVSWKTMVDRTRELEYALGNGIKRVEENEKETVVIQRRALRFKNDTKKGKKINIDDLIPLRPCPDGAIGPDMINSVIGKELLVDKKGGDCIYSSDCR